MKKKAKDQHPTFEKGATSEKLNSHSSQKFGETKTPIYNERNNQKTNEIITTK